MSITDGSNPLKESLPLFLFQLLFIVIVARAVGALLKYLKQPQVVAEVITGLLLGPSVMGHIPGYTKAIFPPESLDIMYVVANIGLIFFMFLIGLELDPAMLKSNFKTSCIIAVTGMVVPFAIGAGISVPLHQLFLDSKVPFSSFLMFVGVAFCITAFPILARILAEEGLTNSALGVVAIASAAINDVIAWILLALVVSIAKASGMLNALWVVLIMSGCIVIVFAVVRPILEKLNNAGEKRRETLFVVTLLFIIAASWVTEVIGIHAIFGGFIMGVIVPRDGNFAHVLTERIEHLVVVLLLPLYFTYSGLRTSLGALDTWISWGAVVVVILLACLGKIVGTIAAARIVKQPWRESVALGILMNTKGLVELIVLNIGLDAGVLNEELFSIFVLMALITTMITAPALHFAWLRYTEPPAPASSAYDSLSSFQAYT